MRGHTLFGSPWRSVQTAVQSLDKWFSCLVLLVSHRVRDKAEWPREHHPRAQQKTFKYPTTGTARNGHSWKFQLTPSLAHYKTVTTYRHWRTNNSTQLRDLNEWIWAARGNPYIWTKTSSKLPNRCNRKKDYNSCAKKAKTKAIFF